MATIHTGTTMAPTKLELLSGWLPRQPWYRGTGAPPALSRAGGFRLDDPDGRGRHRVRLRRRRRHGEETTYAVPMSYRAAPLPGAEQGADRHLRARGPRHAVDLRRGARPGRRRRSCSTFVRGGVDAQSQSRSDTADPSVGRQWPSAGRLTAPTPLRVRDSEPGRTTVAVELTDAAAERPLSGSLHLLRVLEQGTGTETDLGRVEADWTRLDGATARGPVVVIR